jgi:DME family drug/metabolite transporter
MSRNVATHGGRGRGLSSLTRVRRPSAVLLVVCSGWGTIGLVVRALDLPAAAITSGRVWVGAAGLGIVLAAGRGTSGAPLFSYRPARVAVTGVILGAHWLAFISALQRAPIGTVVLIVFLGPIGVAAAAPRVLGERSSPRTLAALALALAGLALVALPDVRSSGALGPALALLAAVLFVALVLASKPLAAEYGGLRLAFSELAVAGVVLLPVGLRAGWGRPEVSWLWLLVLGLVHTALGVSLYLAALARVPAVHAGILGYLEPAGAVVCGWLFLNEQPGPATIAGAAMIVAAGVLVLRTDTARVEVVGVPG